MPERATASCRRPQSCRAIAAAFGCNFDHDIPVAKVLALALDIAADNDLEIEALTLADSMAWATPLAIKRVVSEVRSKYPQLAINLHLHDTRGLGIANAFAGLEVGVDRFDAAVAGL